MRFASIAWAGLALALVGCGSGADDAGRRADGANLEVLAENAAAPNEPAENEADANRAGKAPADRQ